MTRRHCKISALLLAGSLTLLPVASRAADAVATTSVAAPRSGLPTFPLRAADVMAQMQRVADWHLANPGGKDPRVWEQGVLYTGLMALAEVAPVTTYRDALLTRGQVNDWQPGRRIYHADDQAVTQTYLRLYEQFHDPHMLAPTRERFDFILANPKIVPYTMTGSNSSDTWSWCDALFMAPAAWAQMSALTGDARYVDFMDKEWWRTTDFLYDKAEHFFFRDRTFFDQKAANGRQVFWARGNGWVYAGIARVLNFLPRNHPNRPRYVQLFREMTEAMVRVQGEDGLWRSSLLDPAQVPQGESSGTALFTFGLQWGINHGLLDAAKYQPVVNRAWLGLQTRVQPGGKLGSVQPVGAAPGAFSENSTDVYGVGAFLLAGSEIYKHLVPQDAERR